MEKTLLSGVTTKNVFSRGIPKADTLQKPEINALFKTFPKSYIELDSASKSSGVEFCVKQGWIYETASDIADKLSQILHACFTPPPIS